MPAVTGTTTRMTITSTDGAAALGRLRLLQLTSPALPVGAFAYSQGLEWAVEAGWVEDSRQLADWLQGLIDDSLTWLELPVLRRLYLACEHGDARALADWGSRLYAARETRELRAEERQRARALTTLLADLGVARAGEWRGVLLQCQAAPFALAAQHWRIGIGDCVLGYAWAWLENQVAAAVKLVPLGQTEGQRVQLALAEQLPAVAERAARVADDEVGAGAMAMAIASARHETQYSRLFRS